MFTRDDLGEPSSNLQIISSTALDCMLPTASDWTNWVNFHDNVDHGKQCTGKLNAHGCVHRHKIKSLSQGLESVSQVLE